ncbi:MAG: helix-turn-helix transcriptional regulator [Berryella intestinalis]|nr:helix-turn-helix transcriptional regulator [Berryella intestinalis]MDD7369065.1 helix-turn-helix transcriptional regulator [Berryella intestinalis]MDY3128803.1 helix-turn-helix transcriptional regulator [Berryella intestinalis]
MGIGDRDDRNRPVYMIGVAAQLAGMHPQTLRSYEQKGLVNPQRTSGNTRMYSQADIERLELITELTDEGINLAGVIRILDLQGRLDERDRELDDLHKKVRRLADRVHELETRENVASLVRSGQGGLALRRLP